VYSCLSIIIINKEHKIKFLSNKHGWIGSHTSACISYRGWLDLDADSFEKLLQNCLPTKHPSHNWFKCLMDGRPFNLSFCIIIFKLSKFTCLSLICQSQVWYFTHVFRHLDTFISMFRKKNIMFFVMVTFAIIVLWVSSNV
jgi:hypothetical protein